MDTCRGNARRSCAAQVSSCCTRGLRQAAERSISVLRAFDNAVRNVTASIMVVAAHREKLASPFQRDFHIG